MVQDKFDLQERTARFGENIIDLCQKIKINSISQPIINQLIRSGTSIGANYSEANGASSKKDFKNKIHITKKESEETKHWLRMLAKCYPEYKDKISALWKETQELTLIFAKTLRTLNNKT
ncbi:MAG: four helix bundle protein [Candidatus Colwellbacteria bacterium]|nr:four helix bundle protein [Candidatus Colwellbacteria bacterium]